MKRAFDILFSGLVLLALSPVMLSALFLVWFHDRHSPIYKARRVGRNDQDFMMIKIRSMVVNADKTGVNSTGVGDNRITPVGKYIRRFKLDELSQFWNVLKGDMSVVGPRPNTRNWGVDLYTQEEMKLLSVRPGITDLSSIVFSDEGDILGHSDEADALYNRIIRPWKSRLGLLYVAKSSIFLDIQIIWLTGVAIVSKPAALRGVHRILTRLGADPELIEVCRREGTLPAAPPPGGAQIFGAALAEAEA
ncbi:sugar transferase [Caulobacter mirabilis]|uniref:Sugar transferase n=1 Tax=Caulobacter mirabilis TaxID=69666 RepID=A0A2D2AT05_9CAUL|nr:sugar transferase [Caulobacter mirabilis]ATQ41140.1 sugar transferase [Caulobacter mirabilis]